MRHAAVPSLAVTTIAAELLTVTFVDSGGITRAKTVPAARAAAAASAGIGASSTFSVFTGLDAMGSAHGLEVPTGDLRLVADLDAHVVDGAWAWAPADLVDTDGAPWPTCSRTFARRLDDAATARGLRLEASFESEFTAWHGDDTPLHAQPAYGVEATRAAGPFLLAIVRRLQAVGVEVDQVHPEYSPGQLEVSVGRTGPLAAADRVVLVRDVIRTVARELGLRVSLSAEAAPRRARQRRARPPVASGATAEPLRHRRGATAWRPRPLVPGGLLRELPGARRRRLRAPGLVPAARAEPLDGRLRALGPREPRGAAAADPRLARTRPAAARTSS